MQIRVTVRNLTRCPLDVPWVLHRNTQRPASGTLVIDQAKGTGTITENWTFSGGPQEFSAQLDPDDPPFPSPFYNGA